MAACSSLGRLLSVSRPALSTRARLARFWERLYATPAREAATVTLAFTAATLIATYPLIRHLGQALPNGLGDSLLNAWILAWDADRLLVGLRGLWDAPVFFPYSSALAYSEHLLGIAVFTAPLQWALGNPVLVYNVAFLASYVLAGGGMYLLAFALTGSRPAAVVAGVAFAFHPNRADHIAHLQVLMSGWMPIGLWALHRYFGTGSRIALLGFVAAFLLQGLSNGYYLYYFVIPVAVVVGCELLVAGRSRLSALVDLAVAAALILVVLAPVALAYVAVRADQGHVRSRAVMQRYSADLTSYAHVSPALRVWGDTLPRGRPEARLFPGFALAALAVVGVATVRRQRDPDRRPWPPASRVVGAYGCVVLAGVALSLGPEPAAWGRTLVSSGPYDWLVAIVPGFDGLRAVGRISIVVNLGLAVLAALGVRAIVAWRPPTVRLTTALALAGLAFAEGYAAPIRVAAVETEAESDHRRAYAWLRDRPEGALLELPFEANEPANTTRYMYGTLEHRHPIVNGRSGYVTPLVYYLRHPASPLRDPSQFADAVRGLRALGVKYIAVDADGYLDATDAAATLAGMSRSADQIVATVEFGATTMFTLEDTGASDVVTLDETSLTAVAEHAFEARASHMDHRLDLAFDGDPDTRWLSGQAQAGHEWIECVFDEPRDIGRVRVQMAIRSLGDYPRDFLIEAAGDDGEYRQLARLRGLPALMQGVIDDVESPAIDVTLPPNLTRTLRLRQTGQAAPWYWSIHELALWER